MCLCSCFKRKKRIEKVGDVKLFKQSSLTSSASPRVSDFLSQGRSMADSSFSPNKKKDNWKTAKKLVMKYN